MVAVAQLVRAPDCGSGGRGFETHQPPSIKLMLHKPTKHLFIIFTILLMSCSLDWDKITKPNLPYWTTKFEFPLMSTTFFFNSLSEEDSSIQVHPFGDNGDSIFVIEIDTTIIDTTLEYMLEDIIAPITANFSQSVKDVTVEDTHVVEKVGFDPVGISPIEDLISKEIGTIKLNNFTPTKTNKFFFGDLYGDADSYNGLDIPIPGFPLIPLENSFIFADLDTAIFNSGVLTLTIDNHLKISLNDIKVILLKKDGSPIDSTNFDPNPILPNSFGIGTIDLSGDTLYKEIDVRVTGYSNGSSGNLIEVDINDYFTVEIWGENLEVISATAKLPQQTITDNSFITLELDSNQVELATILEGRLVVAVDNHMDISSTVNIKILSLIHSVSNDTFNIEININANETGNVNTEALKYYSLDMDINDQLVYYTYTVITDPTSGMNTATIKSDDKIDILIGIDGGSETDDITFSYFKGMITPKEMEFDGSISIESESDILEADLGSGQIVITVDNQVNQTVGGAPSAIIIVEELLDNQGQPIEITIEQIADIILQETIDISNYKIVMKREDQNLHYTADVITPYGETGEYSLTDSIRVDIEVKGLTFTEVRGYFTQDAIINSNTIALENETTLNTAKMKTGELQLTIQNGIGVIAAADITINEFSKDGNIFNIGIPISASPYPQDTTIHLDGHMITLPTNDQAIHYTSEISIQNNEEMTLTFGDSIQVEVNIDNISFESISGKIDTVEVEIEPVEQSISIPDKMDKINFEQVNMYLDFDTDIEIPILISLIVTASNEAGDTLQSSRTQNITDNPYVILPDAANLINIKPNIIRAEGRAMIAGEGTVSSDQYIAARMQIEIPFAFIFTDTARVTTDPELYKLELPEAIESMTLFVDYLSPLNFGADLIVFSGQDTSNLSDTLIIFNLEPYDNLFPVGRIDSISLNQEQIEWLADSIYLQTQINLIGPPEESEESAKLFSTDSLNIILSGSSRIYVNKPNSE